MVCFVEHCFRPPPTVKDPHNYLGIVRSMPADFNIGLAFNHSAYGDPVAVLSAYRQLVDPNQRQILVPASEYHTKFFNNPVFATAYVLGAPVFQYEKASIIQAYQVGNPRYGYTQEQAQRSYSRFVRKVHEMHENGPFTLLIAPEGHRSEKEHSALQKAEPGIGFFMRQIAPWILIPIGITYDRPFKRNNVNLRSGPRLHIAEPIVLEEPIKKQDQEEVIAEIMVRIGSVLPETKWGYYASQIREFLESNARIPSVPNQP